MIIHGDNSKQNEETKEYHVTEKKIFYKDDDITKHDNLKWICYTKSLTVGVDS